jgi:DNA-binding transcriptional MerR regulator
MNTLRKAAGGLASTLNAVRAAGARDARGSRSFSIGDLSREFGVTLRTLRFYEDRGLLQPRREGATRVYDAADRARLSVILKGKQLGFTLTEILNMVAQEEGSVAAPPDLNLSVDQIEVQISNLETQRAEIDRALAELRAHRDRLTG